MPGCVTVLGGTHRQGAYPAGQTLVQSPNFQHTPLEKFETVPVCGAFPQRPPKRLSTPGARDKLIGFIGSEAEPRAVRFSAHQHSRIGEQFQVGLDSPGQFGLGELQEWSQLAG